MKVKNNLGIWRGFGFDFLFNAQEWYIQLLAPLLLLGVVVAILFIAVEGVENIRRKYF